MKKTLIIILVLIVAVIAGVGIFLWQRKPETIEDTLPPGALLYVKFSGVDENFTAIRSTAFWQSLKTVRWDYLLEQSQLTIEQKELLRAIPEKLAGPATALLFKQFFGREFAFAFYPPATDPKEIIILPEQDMYPFVRKMFSRVLLVTRVGGKGLFIDFLSGLLGRGASEFRMETVDRNGYKFHHVTVPQTDLRLGFVRLGNFLVAGIDDEILEEGIAAFRRKAASLAGDEHFRKSRRRALPAGRVGSPSANRQGLTPSEFTGYWDMAQISEYINEYLTALVNRMEEEIRRSSQEPDALEAMQKNVEQLKTLLEERSRLGAGLDVLGISGRWEERLALKFDLYFEQDKLDAERAARYECPAAENETLAFSPKDIVGYQWSNCMDLNVSWEQIRKEAAGIRQRSGEAVSPVDAIENVLDIDIGEDVLPAVGEEMGGYLKGVRLGNVFPVPDILFFVKIKDENKVRELFTKLRERFLDHAHQEEYNGISLEYIVSPAVGDVELAYCILDKYVLFALNRSSLKESIDTFQKHLPSLAANPDFLEGNFPVGQTSRAVQFLKVDAAAQSLETVLAWAGTRAAAQDAQREAFQAGSAQRLADVVKETETKKNELDETRKKAAVLEEAVRDLESRQLDTAAQQKEFDQLRERTQILGEEITSMEKQQADLGEIIKGYERYTLNRKRREEMEQKIVGPLLKSLGFLKTWRLRTTVQPGVFETSVFLEVE